MRRLYFPCLPPILSPGTLRRICPISDDILLVIAWSGKGHCAFRTSSGCNPFSRTLPTTYACHHVEAERACDSEPASTCDFSSISVYCHSLRGESCSAADADRRSLVHERGRRSTIASVEQAGMGQRACQERRRCEDRGASYTDAVPAVSYIEAYASFQDRVAAPAAAWAAVSVDASMIGEDKSLVVVVLVVLVAGNAHYSFADNWNTILLGSPDSALASREVAAASAPCYIHMALVARLVMSAPVTLVPEKAPRPQLELQRTS